MEEVTKYYIEGKITASYSGYRRDDLGDSKHTLNEIRDLLNAEVSTFKRIEKYDARYKVVGDNYIYFESLNGVIIKNNEKAFRTNLSAVYINDIILSEHGKDGIYSFGKMEGVVTATIEKPIHKTVFPETKDFDLNAERVRFSFTNNTSGTLTSIDENTGRPVRKITKSSSWGNSWLWIPGFLFFLLLLLILGKALLPLLIIAAIVLLIGGLFRYAQDFIGFIIGAFLIIGLLSWLISSTGNLKENRDSQQGDTNKETTEIKKDTSGNKADSFLVVHHRIWKDYDGETYEGDVTIKQGDYFNSKKYHTEFSESGYRNENAFWGGLYKSLSVNDEPELKSVYYLFDSIGKANLLSRTKFAEMVVCFAQDIRYVLITDNDCDQYRLENPSDSRVLDEFGCFGPCKYGVQSPVEFMYNLKGDCDTRTMFLFAILSHYGYDVAILNSVQYKHSILGINMPVGGISKSYNGKEYFFWETTATGFKPGTLPHQNDNTDYWNFMITSK